jgi:cytochrome b561
MSNGPPIATATAAPAYSVTARALHWITAALVLTMIPVAVAMVNVSSGPLQDWLYDLHRSLGATVIPVIIVRFAYRLTHPPVPLPDEIPRIQRTVARATHWTLYGLLLVQPFVGWVATSAYRAPITVFGLFVLPPIWPQDQPFSERLYLVHQLIGLAIACLVVLHITAALYHHYVRHDRVLLRMISG